MTDAMTQTAAAAQPVAAAGVPPRAATQRRSRPVLEKLAELYPRLFAETALPLKRGIFQDLLAAHPDSFERATLKEALGQHTRSTRYLTAVAGGQQRHDLSGRPVEAMAPQHVYQALLEVFRRRQMRTQEDLRPKLRWRIVQAIEASGLVRAAYAELMRGRDDTANAVLDEAIAEATMRSAKDEALLRAFEAGSQTIELFARTYGIDVHAASQALQRALRNRALELSSAGTVAAQ